MGSTQKSIDTLSQNEQIRNPGEGGTARASGRGRLGKVGPGRRKEGPAAVGEHDDEVEPPLPLDFPKNVQYLAL